MAEFLVKIADERGRLAQQVENGYSASEVRERFVQQGFLVYWVKPRGLFSAGEIRLPTRRTVKPTQFLIFNQQFLTLIKAGLPILNSLDLLIRRQKDRRLQGLLENVRDRVKSGELLSDAFSRTRSLSEDLYDDADGWREKRQHGRSSGPLHCLPTPRADLQEEARRIAGLPDLLVTVVLFMVIFLVTYVVPEFAKLFENLNAKLPDITVFMLAVGNQRPEVCSVLGYRVRARGRRAMALEVDRHGG